MRLRNQKHTAWTSDCLNAEVLRLSQDHKRIRAIAGSSERWTGAIFGCLHLGTSNDARLASGT